MKRYILLVCVFCIHNFGYSQEKLPQFEETIKWILDFVNNGGISYKLTEDIITNCQEKYIVEIQFDDYTKIGKTEVNLQEYIYTCSTVGDIKSSKKVSNTKFHLEDILDISEIQSSKDGLLFYIRIFFKKSMYENNIIRDCSDYKCKTKIESYTEDNIPIGKEKLIYCNDKIQIGRFRNALRDVILQVGGGVNKKLY